MTAKGRLKNLTSEERVRLARKAGKKSVAERKKRKEAKEVLEDLLSQVPKGANKEYLESLGIKVDETTSYNYIVLSGLINKATMGDPSANRLLWEMQGQDTTESLIKKDQLAFDKQWKKELQDYRKVQDQQKQAFEREKFEYEKLKSDREYELKEKQLSSNSGETRIQNFIGFPKDED